MRRRLKREGVSGTGFRYIPGGKISHKMLKRIITLYRDAYTGLPRGAWILALAEFINRSGFMVLFFLNIYLTRRLNFTLNQAGRILSAYGLGAIAGGYLGGYLSDRIGARKIQISSLGISGLLLVATSFTTMYGPMLLLLFLYGLISTALFRPMTRPWPVSHPTKCAPRDSPCCPWVGDFSTRRLPWESGPWAKS